MKWLRFGRLALPLLALTIPLAAQTGAGPTIKEIMSQAHKRGGHYFQITRDLQQESPPWPEIQTHTHDLAKLATALGANTAPKGDRVSWQRLTKAYADNAQALEQAATSQDRKAALKAAAALGEASCRACHSAHRK